jgi:hypothetical protein
MNEEHRLEFKHKGLDCLLSRNPKMFHWCGYVAVPKGHPLFGKHYNDLDDIEVHGGLTFSSECEGMVCHVPKAGEDDEVWWFGWDAAHLYDLIPTMLKFSLEHKMPAFADEKKCLYKDVNFVTEQTIFLADQLAKIA